MCNCILACGNSSAPPVTTVPKTLDVDSFDDILGDAAAEDLLILRALNAGFTQLNLYRLHVIFGTAQEAQLAPFIDKCNAQGLLIGGIFEGIGTATDMANYNATHSQQFVEFNQEWEYWNGVTTFANWIAQGVAVQAIAGIYPVTAYVSRFALSNYPGMEVAYALQTEQTFDRIQIADYWTTPNETLVHDWLNWMADAWASTGSPTPYPIVALFSAEVPFLGGSYLLTNSTDACYLSFQQQYAMDAGIPNKSSIDIVSQAWFDYEWLTPFMTP